jgi:hypothetical protein
MHSRWMFVSALALSACATTQFGSGRLERAEASIKAAEEIGANAVPDARLYVQLAKDQTTTAKRLASDGDDRAPMMLARAQADADLALVMARESAARAEAVRAGAELETVQQRGTP